MASLKPETWNLKPFLSPETGNRKPSLYILLLAALVLAGSACQRGEPEHGATFAVFGTQVTVTVRDVESELAEQAFGELSRDFQRMHRQWHPWAPGALTELNEALPSGDWLEATPELIELIKAARAMEVRSGGRFNAAMGGLIGLWGFHTSDYPITDPPPDSEQIQTLLDRKPSMQDIEVRDEQVRSTNPAVQLDFSGIAKGLAARLACQRLAGFDIEVAMIDLGGDVMVCGSGQNPWRVAIADQNDAIIEIIELDQSMAVFSSGISQRYREFDGKRHAHILDPTSGQPVDAIFQVTVIDPDPILADAAATALVVAGPDHWQSVATDMGVKRVVIVDAEGLVFRSIND